MGCPMGYTVIPFNSVIVQVFATLINLYKNHMYSFMKRINKLHVITSHFQVSVQA